MEARYYQTEAHDAVISAIDRGVKRCYYVLPTGTGKTYTFIAIAKTLRERSGGLPVLILAHRNELLQQARNAMLKVDPNLNVGIEQADVKAMRHCDVVVASIQSLQRADCQRLEWLIRKGMSGIIVDECFPAGTIIDGKPIETLRVGDSVLSVNQNWQVEKRPVTSIQHSKCTVIVRIKLHDGRDVICTPNHPIAVVCGNELDYIPAVLLQCGTMVPSINTIPGVHYYGEDSDNAMLGVRNSCRAIRAKRVRTSKARQSLLLRRTPRYLREQIIFRKNVKNQPHTCQRTNEAQKPNDEPSKQSKIINNASVDGLETSSSRRKWQRPNNSTTTTCLRSRVEDGSRREYQPETQRRLSSLLQTRYSQRSAQNRRGGRREFSYGTDSARAGSQTRQFPVFARVDSVEVYEQGNHAEFEQLCPGGIVYNFGVEKNHNYFANGILVHNCHHSAADSYERVLNRFGQDCPVIGCTATPARLDKLALHGWAGAPFQEMVYDYPIRKAIDDGFLCDIKGYQVRTNIDISKVHKVAGDFNAKELANLIVTDHRTRSALKNWEEIASDRQTIVFCLNVEHAISAAEIWSTAGHAAAVVHGATPKHERAQILADFKSGKVHVICNCEILTEGFDHPATSCIVMLRPTTSWSLYMQMGGRGTRICDGKENMYLLDVVDNATEHKFDNRPESKRKKESGQVTCAAMLGLPDDLDLEGHSAIEADNLAQLIATKAALLAVWRASSYSDLVDMLQKVQLFAGASDKDEDPLREVSPYRWVKMGEDYKLSVPSAQVTLRRGKNGMWWYRLLDAQSFNPDNTTIDWRGHCDSDEINRAIQYADKLADETFGSRIHAARRDAKWRQDPVTKAQLTWLRKFKYPESVIATMTKSEASVVLDRHFDKKNAQTPIPASQEPRTASLAM